MAGRSSKQDEEPGQKLEKRANAPTLWELELGTIIAINEDMFEGPIFGPVLVEKAQGMHIASSKNSHSHMMAMTMSFAIYEFKNRLRLFGMHRRGDFEAHITVIGGIENYDGANGYAVVKAINESSQYVREGGEN
ncbi:hypothetical protein LguiA_035017 [Lonicera macranthoides]